MTRIVRNPADKASEVLVVDYFVRFFGLRGYLPRVTVAMGTTRVHDCDAPGGLSVDFSSEEVATAAIRKGERSVKK